MIWLLKPDHPKATEFAPVMTESTGILPGFPAVAGKPVHVAFDGGRLTSDAGILLLAAFEQSAGQSHMWRQASCAWAGAAGTHTEQPSEHAERFGKQLHAAVSSTSANRSLPRRGWFARFEDR